jgi:hypothetical protein
MLINLLSKLNERFHHQHHLSSVQSVFVRPDTGPVSVKDIKYLHPPSIRA